MTEKVDEYVKVKRGWWLHMLGVQVDERLSMK